MQRNAVQVVVCVRIASQGFCHGVPIWILSLRRARYAVVALRHRVVAVMTGIVDGWGRDGLGSYRDSGGYLALHVSIARPPPRDVVRRFNLIIIEFHEYGHGPCGLEGSSPPICGALRDSASARRESKGSHTDDEVHGARRWDEKNKE